MTAANKRLLSSTDDPGGKTTEKLSASEIADLMHPLLHFVMVVKAFP